MSEELAVRPGMRECAFRKYETFISQALKGTITVDPLALPRPMKTSSFVVGIRDAIRAQRVYNYRSATIPPNADLQKLKVQELANGKVKVVNEFQDRANKMAAQSIENMKSVIVDIDGNVAHSNQKEIIHPENTRRVEFDPNIMLQWCDERINGPLKTKRSELLWMFKAMCPEDVEMIKMIPTQYPELDVEELGHGWWRLHK